MKINIKKSYIVELYNENDDIIEKHLVVGTKKDAEEKGKEMKKKRKNMEMILAEVIDDYGL